MRELFSDPGERWAYLPRTSKCNKRIAFFVHGYNPFDQYHPNFLTTWGNLPSLLREHADGSDIFKNWDYFFLGYKVDRVEGYLDIAEIIATHWNAAANGTSPFLHQYATLSLVGHSLGTLGIRQLLAARSLHQSQLLPSIHSVLLFGSPVAGSDWARFSPDPIAHALRPFGPQLRMLNVWCSENYDSQTWPHSRSVFGNDDRIVNVKGRTFVDWTGDQKSTVNLGHSALCKPKNWKQSQIKGFLEEAFK